MWGPDMVLEVTSALTHSGQLEERVAWFSLYGVREYWLVQPAQKEIAVSSLRMAASAAERSSTTLRPSNRRSLPEFDRCLRVSGLRNRKNLFRGLLRGAR